MCSRHAAGGIVGVEPHGVRDRIPEALDVRLVEHGARPALVRVGDDRPVADAVAQPERGLRHFLHARLPDPLAVEVGEELGLRVARDGEQRTADAAELVVPLDEPRRRIAELVDGGVRDVRAAHMLVAVLDVDEGGARLVRRARDLACERRVLDERVDTQDLAGLQVQADADCELGVLLEAIVCGVTRRRTIATRCVAGALRRLAEP